jgi:hypothetical protein
VKIGRWDNPNDIRMAPILAIIADGSAVQQAAHGGIHISRPAANGVAHLF